MLEINIMFTCVSFQRKCLSADIELSRPTMLAKITQLSSAICSRGILICQRIKKMMFDRAVL